MDEQQVIRREPSRGLCGTSTWRRVGHDWFVGQPDRAEGRLFGGQVLGQAALAAGRTAPDPTLHSLHAYFLRPGRPDAPIEYSVERVRDGRTFTARRVLVRQEGVPICDVTASFVHPEDGISHQEPMPDAPDPETLQDARIDVSDEGRHAVAAGAVRVAVAASIRDAIANAGRIDDGA